MNKRGWALVLLAGVVALSVLAPAVSGQEIATLPACSQGLPPFCADAAYFLEDGRYVLEVYLVLCNEALQFVRSKNGYTASADVMIIVFDDNGKQVAGDTYRVRLRSPSYGETKSVDSCIVRTGRFQAQPGDFKMTISISDRDTHRKGILSAALSIDDLTAKPALSDIVFLTEEAGRASKRWPGYVPNVKRSYREIDKPVVFAYELYNIDLGDSFNVEYEVLDDENSRVYGFTSDLAGDSSLTRLAKIPLDSLSNKVYTLKVSLLGPDGKEVAHRSKQFQVSTDALYLGRDLDEAVALLYYVADSGFIDRFVKAEPRERKTLWEQFWREKDPTPATPRNEFYEAHLERFKYANRHFRSSVEEGWKTDRGRIYIIYGPPDEVETHPMEVDQGPTEIWYYLENGRRFVFVDETGFGDYVLTSGF